MGASGSGLGGWGRDKFYARSLNNYESTKFLSNLSSIVY